VAKFHVDRPRELGDLAVKKRREKKGKNICSET